MNTVCFTVLKEGGYKSLPGEGGYKLWITRFILKMANYISQIVFSKVYLVKYIHDY